MTRPYPDLGGASDWLKENFKPIISTTQIWVVTRHQYGISVLISQTSFRGETSGEMSAIFTGYLHVSVNYFTQICANIVTQIERLKLDLGTLLLERNPRKCHI